MPFVSKSQWRACFARQAHGGAKGWDCREFAHATKSYGKLPKHKKKKPGRRSKKAETAFDFLWKAGRLNAGDPDDVLPGGVGDSRKPSDFSAHEMHEGQEEEMEHTKNPAVARDIAKDHLAEDPHYYTKLERLESMTAKEKTPTGGFVSRQIRKDGYMRTDPGKALDPVETGLETAIRVPLGALLGAGTASLMNSMRPPGAPEMSVLQGAGLGGAAHGGGVLGRRVALALMEGARRRSGKSPEDFYDKRPGAELGAVLGGTALGGLGGAYVAHKLMQDLTPSMLR